LEFIAEIQALPIILQWPPVFGGNEINNAEGELLTEIKRVIIKKMHPANAPGEVRQAVAVYMVGEHPVIDKVKPPQPKNG
jgi:hypothetical protein